MNEDLKIKLFSSLNSDEIKSTSADLLEVGLDSFLEDNVLKEIPILSTIRTFYKVGGEIRKRFFLKKILIFLNEVSESPLAKRQNFLKEIERNPRKKSEFEEILLFIIDRLDSIRKPRILGRLLRNHILGFINYEDTTRLSFIINRVYINDLDYLINFQPGIQADSDIASSLQSIGLLSDVGIDGGIFDDPFSSGTLYELNRYGKMLLKYGLDIES